LEVRGSRHLKPPEARREVEVKVKVEWEDNSASRTQDSALWRETEVEGERREPGKKNDK
jgi:hypothetical protein